MTVAIYNTQPGNRVMGDGEQQYDVGLEYDAGLKYEPLPATVREEEVNEDAVAS